MDLRIEDMAWIIGLNRVFIELEVVKADPEKGMLFDHVDSHLEILDPF